MIGIMAGTHTGVGRAGILAGILTGPGRTGIGTVTIHITAITTIVLIMTITAPINVM